MVEEERKYQVSEGFTLPDLAACVPPAGRIEATTTHLDATYHDTADLRLARSGVSLRHRVGDERPWTVKLPADAPGRRHEVSRPGGPRRLPDDLLGLVTAYTRGAELKPVARLRTVRRAYRIHDRDDRVLAEVADDVVTVRDGRRVLETFREVEVERKAGDRELLDRVGELLTAAGARTGAFTAKHVRALGAAATAPPDLVPPGPLPRKPTAGDVVTAAVRRSVGRLLAHDPLVRLREPVGDDDTAVHQMRVGCRRLRSDLRTFRPLVRQQWAEQLRGELSWLADLLGAARDAEVLRDRLRRTAAADPVCPVDQPSVDRIDEVLDERHRAALATLDAALTSPRYVALVDALVAAADRPPLTAAADRPAAQVLPGLVSRPWRRLATGGKGSPAAADLDPLDADEVWHGVRITGKKARYAVEAVAGALGGPAAKLARSLSRVQDLLGEHQDAAVAARTWTEVAAREPDRHDLAVTAGRLAERERAAIRQVRADFPEAWRRAGRRGRTDWLR
jgi:CHAD domain-containing protein